MDKQLTGNQISKISKSSYKKNRDVEDVDGYVLINNSIGVTREHRMYINNKWEYADNIQVGDHLLDPDGNQITVTTLEWFDGGLYTFNLHTGDKTHNYFADNVLVHNAIAQKNARGGSWITNRNTLISAGEAGTERIDITPLGQDSYIPFNSGSGQQAPTIVNVFIGNEKLESYVLNAVTKELRN